MLKRWLRINNEEKGDAAASPPDDDFSKPIWLDAPSDAEEKLRKLIHEASASVINPPQPEDSLSHLSPHEKQVLETLIRAGILTGTDVASLLGTDKAHAYEVMISLAEKGYARWTTTDDNEKAIVSKVSSIEEVSESRWQCAGCHAFLKVNEITLGICPYCGSGAFWAP